MENVIPRRNDVQQLNKYENEVLKCISSIEEIGADPKLTNAQMKMNEAFHELADYFDENPLPTEPKTLGQQRVHADFNPAKNDVVDQIKNKSAELIDSIETLRKDCTNGEKHRVISEAQTCIETGCMYGVKACFK